MLINNSLSLAQIPKSGRSKAVLSKEHFIRLPDWCLLAGDVPIHIETIVKKSKTETKTTLLVSFEVEYITTCQRCLEKMIEKIKCSITGKKKTDHDKNFYFSREEIFDIENAYCKNSDLDLLRLCEDEILLALPMVPRHEFDCGGLEYRKVGKKIGKPSPFAMLSKKKDKR